MCIYCKNESTSNYSHAVRRHNLYLFAIILTCEDEKHFWALNIAIENGLGYCSGFYPLMNTKESHLMAKKTFEPLKERLN